MNDLLWKLKWGVKAITPPILVLAAKTILIKLGLRKPDPKREPGPAPETDSPARVGVRPRGLGTRRLGSDRQRLGCGGRRRGLPREVAAVPRGDRGRQAARRLPRGRASEEITGEDPAAHNLVVTFAYVAALAAHGKERLTFLDWGGGVVTTARSPAPSCPSRSSTTAARSRRPSPSRAIWGSRAGSCRTTPGPTAAMTSLWRAARSSTPKTGVLSSPHSQRSRAAISTSPGSPTRARAPSFHILQRAYRYGYETEYVGWVVGRAELLDCAAGLGLTLEREFVIDAWLSAPGAPEDPIGHRGFLFSVGGARARAAA